MEQGNISETIARTQFLHKFRYTKSLVAALDAIPSSHRSIHCCDRAAYSTFLDGGASSFLHDDV